MSEPLAIEDLKKPNKFIKQTSVSFNSKKLELLSQGKNFMFGEFSVMGVKPSNKVNIIADYFQKLI